MWWIFQFINNYISIRMDGLYGFPEKQRRYSPARHTCKSNENILRMPEYLRKGIGKYGSEIYGRFKEVDQQEQKYLGILRNYVNTLDLPVSKTYHAYESDLPFSASHSIHMIKYSVPYWHIFESNPGRIVRGIHEMNEIYVSSIGGQGSDRVFETPHIDGIFAWLPWCRTYRCIVAIQGNRGVDTIFPLSNNTYTLETGEYVAFDYNRAIHYIAGNSSIMDDRLRIILKLHYIATPQWMPSFVANLYILIHGKYNAFLRGLFLQSQIEDVPSEKRESETSRIKMWISAMINGGTTIYLRLFLVALFFYKSMFS